MATKTKPLRIMGLKKSPDKAGREAYSFGLCCVGGLIYNGFLYIREKGAIIAPAVRGKDGKRYPLVKGHGVHWKRLQQMIEEYLETNDDGNETTDESGLRDEQGD